MKLAKVLIFGFFFTALIFAQSTAQAFFSSSFNGTADFYAGAAPPPGFHLIDYNLHIDITDVEHKGLGITGGNGNLTAVALRPIYVSNKGLLGGNLLLHSIIPVITLEAELESNGTTVVDDGAGGLGDVYFGVGMAWHTPIWHWLAVLDVITPTGDYNNTNNLNVGNNAAVIEPVVAVTGLFPNGLELSAKLMYSYFTKNHDFGPNSDVYQTGQAVHLDYLVSYAVTQNLKLGVTGWFWEGLEDDELNGKRLKGSRDRERAVGPAVRFQDGKFSVLAKWVAPITADNRIAGNQTWIDLVYSF